MENFIIRFNLISDTAFGSGSGMDSQVDLEVQYDRWGCPFLGGRTLKGLLREECGNILYALSLQDKEADWQAVAVKLFGQPGAQQGTEGAARFGNAELPDLLHRALINAVESDILSAQEVLHSLTAVRAQTAIDYVTGAAREKSLHYKRVILRQTPLEAKVSLDFDDDAEKSLQLLAACVKALRRAGSGRNRGNGELIASLHDLCGNDLPKDPCDVFFEALNSPEVFKQEVLR